MDTVSVKEPYLATLAVNLEHIPTGFNWQSSVACLDLQNIMVGHGGILSSSNGMEEPHLTICKPCHSKLERKQLLPQALVNYRWVGEQPEALKGLTWLEEKLVVRRHLVGAII